MEGMADQMNHAGDVTVSEWSPRFWQHAWTLTKDDHRRFSHKAPSLMTVTSLQAIRDLREALRVHAENTMMTSAVDARHGVSFGVAAYGLDVLIELLGLGNSTGILGRMGLRCLTEILINFTTLATRDEDDRWRRFRDYGYGQAKLAYLKMLEVQELPSFVTVEILEQLSNEGVWHEFREMHVGNWDDSDLRKMSDAMGIKEDVYDKYYDWSSAFVHGNWAAVRDAEYDLCLNPLHRLHRVVAASRTSLLDVSGDAIEMVNRVSRYSTVSIRRLEDALSRYRSTQTKRNEGSYYARPRAR